MLNKYDSSKLINDMKLLIRASKVVSSENNDNKRQFAEVLVEDIGNRIINDINEMTEGFTQPEIYDGSGRLEEE